MTCPLPFPFPYGFTDGFLLRSFPQFYVGNSVGPPDTEYIPSTFVDECLNFGLLVRTPLFGAIKKN